MRILAWNLNHRARRRTIPDSVAAAILAPDPDIVVLTEYVEGHCHSKFCEQLGAGGLTFLAFTAARSNHNQVFIFSRTPLEVLPIVIPESLDHAQSNLIRVGVPAAGLEVMGVRVPMYKRVADARTYWDWFESYLAGLLAAKVAVVGDLNADPERKGGRGTLHLARLVRDGWKLPSPAGAWSYYSATGHTSRLDHALVSTGIRIENVRTWTTFTAINSLAQAA